MRDVQKGATLPDGGNGGVPHLNFFPFPRRKGMVGTPTKSFKETAEDFLYKAGITS